MGLFGVDRVQGDLTWGRIFLLNVVKTQMSNQPQSCAEVSGVARKISRGGETFQGGGKNFEI